MTNKKQSIYRNTDNITREEVMEYFTYKKGLLHKNFYYPNGIKYIKESKPVGNISKSGYLVVKFKDTLVLVHRLIYLYHNDSVPELVDHIDRNRLNNKITNLRGATYSENSHNRSLSTNNKTGHKGLTITTTTKGKVKYKVSCAIRGKVWNFTSEDKSEALQALNDYKTEHLGEFMTKVGGRYVPPTPKRLPAHQRYKVEQMVESYLYVLDTPSEDACMIEIYMGEVLSKKYLTPEYNNYKTFEMAIEDSEVLHLCTEGDYTEVVLASYLDKHKPYVDTEGWGYYPEYYGKDLIDEIRLELKGKGKPRENRWWQQLKQAKTLAIPLKTHIQYPHKLNRRNKT